MLVTGKLSYNESNLFIEADAVKRVKKFCYLGMNVDENRKYHSQVEGLHKNISQLARMTFRIKSYLDLKSAKKL